MIDQKLKPRERLDCLLIYHGKDLDIDRYNTGFSGTVALPWFRFPPSFYHRNTVI